MTAGGFGNFFSSLDQLRIGFDYLADYTPVLSTATNLVDLFQQAFPEEGVASTDTYSGYLKNKHVVRCVVGLIPFVGNLALIIYDIAKCLLIPCLGYFFYPHRG